MNPGKLRKRGWLMRLAGEKDLRFEAARSLWTEMNETGRKNLFSQVGIGSDGAEFLLRASDLTLHDAILYKGQHYFLTNIEQMGIHPVYFKVSAARVPCETITVSRTVTAKDNLGRAERTVTTIGSFPGCITEKYLRTETNKSHLELEKRRVVVAPKAAAYKPGDIFEILGESWRVVLVHDLESWKNEYEVERTEDL